MFNGRPSRRKYGHPIVSIHVIKAAPVEEEIEAEEEVAEGEEAVAEGEEPATEEGGEETNAEKSGDE